MRKNICVIYRLALFFVIFVCFGLSAKEYKPVAPSDYRPTKKETFLLQGMLKEMGLELPDRKKIEDGDKPGPEPKPAPGPKPEPRPGPKPEPKPGPKPKPDNNSDDDFWDDDFFDDDKGFDETVEAMDKEFERVVAQWDKEYEEQVARWDRARKDYNKVAKSLHEAAIPVDLLKSGAEQLRFGTPGRRQPGLQQMRPGDFHILPGSLAIPPRNQSSRGTCASFAGVRAMEAILAQYGIPADLSEQHFYYLSKPKCKSTPCDVSKEGSSLHQGFVESSKSSTTGILPEDFCPYIPVRDDRNITYTPLKNCEKRAGTVRAKEIRGVKTLNQVIEKLSNNIPVVVGYKLTNSYKWTNGLVKQFDPANKKVAKGEHVAGHANVLVGYIKLPQSLKREGSFCLIAANSWHNGWGRGAHACITQRWLESNGSMFVSLDAIQLTPYGLKHLELE